MPTLEASSKSVYVQQMFTSIAPKYDLLNHLLSLNIDRLWRKRAVKLSAVKADAQVLDVCCGTGDFSFEFAKALGPQGHVTGTDFVTPMIEIFRKKIQRRGLGQKIVAKFADALKLPFGDQHFDVVSVAFGVRNLADYRLGLSEFYRVLRPGGKLVILEFNDANSPIFGPLFKAYFNHILPRVGRFISNDRTGAYLYLPASVKGFPRASDFLSLMQTSGFNPVQAHPMTLGIVTCFLGIKP